MAVFTPSAPLARASAAATPPYGGFDGQYIGGTWRPGRGIGSLADHNPYSGEVIAEISLASLADLDAAYASALGAQRAWAETLAAQRAAVLMRVAALMDVRHEEIVRLLIRESGSTRTKAELEWQFTRNGIVEAATYPLQVAGRILPSYEAGKENRVYRRALGVVGVISPWNFPLYLSIRTVAPAIALGNAVVLKPAEDTPITGGLLIAKLFEEAGLPQGVLNVVVGMPDVIGDAFTAHPTPKFISFTGSTAVGKHVGANAMQSTALKRLALELGGNAPFVVLDDADLEHAVHAAVVSRFLHVGQICMSTNRIIVDATLYDAFVERFVERVRALRVGDPDDSATVIGPVINAKQLAGIVARIAAARTNGDRLLLGGDAQGLVLPPHVFVDVANDSPLAQGEIFGPVAPIIKARDEAQALEFANATEYGLSSAVFSRDEGRALAFAQRIDAGMTHINDISVNDDPNTMFGGEKNSGLGRFGGEWIVAELTADHWISVQHTPAAYPF
jgi:aldehyde dehydrogenase (NAD+)